MSESRKSGFKKYQKILKVRIKQLAQLISTLPEGYRRDTLIEQKKRMEFELAMVTLTDETHDILQQIVAIDNEYKKFIARQKNGEYVTDLINQNRFLSKSLHEEDKKNCEAFRQLKRSEEERRSKKKIQDEIDASKWLAAHPDIARTLSKDRKEKKMRRTKKK
ncbi:MAG: hypothetical protein ACFFE5_07155 [Candidatus Thorarchaeota archaeon]